MDYDRESNRINVVVIQRATASDNMPSFRSSGRCKRRGGKAQFRGPSLAANPVRELDFTYFARFWVKLTPYRSAPVLL